MSLLRTAVRSLQGSPGFMVVSRNRQIPALALLESIIENAFKPNDMAMYLEKKVLAAANITKFEGGYNDFARVMSQDPKPLIKIAGDVLDEFLLPMINKGKPGESAAKPKGDLKKRDADFRKKLVDRDGLLCAVTGRPDRKYKGPTVEKLPAYLEGAHIIPRTIINKTETINFIQIFTGRDGTHNILDDDGIDNIANGMLLQIDAHKDFDNFLWGILCKNGVYQMKQINRAPPGLSFVPGGVDGAMMFQGKWDRPVPAPGLCRLHFAVGCVLNESGVAAAFADEE